MPLPHTTCITNTTPFFPFFYLFFLSHICFTFCLLYFSLISIFLPTHTSLHFVFFQVSIPLSLTLGFIYCMLNPAPTLQQSEFCESQFPSRNKASPHGSSRIKTHFGTTIWGSFFIVVLISTPTLLLCSKTKPHWSWFLIFPTMCALSFSQSLTLSPP